MTSFAGHTSGLEHRPFSIDSTERYLAAYGAEGTLRIWDVRGGGEPVVERSALPGGKFGKRPQWVDHWGGPALLVADGILRYWHVR